jgi:predicted ATPase/class 3 adenylate cyclase/tetratricopeptide (TPR) repeat protein
MTTSLPTGIVTFLLTDVEGSTRLWADHPEMMAKALASHDEIIADAVQRFDGTLLKPRGEGDSTFAVFARATDALSCSDAMQRAFSAEAWPENTRLRIRAALHTGEAEYRDGDYFGPEVNRSARIRAIAHGGQTILSQATADLVRDHLPDDVTLKDLGAHRLKDLARPEQIYQVAVPAVPDEFPPLRSLDTRPNNLPIQRSRFIGRVEEVQELRKLLGTTSLLTLTGAAGCGKTRLAIQAAAEATEDYPDGVWIIELGGLAEPQRVAEAIGAALSLRDLRGVDLATLTSHIGSKAMLLLLDNCEHLIDACAAAADALLGNCPGLHLLATSREPLGVAGESLFRVAPLSIPDRRRPTTIDALDQYEGVRLFIDRAAQTRAGFHVTNESAPAVAQICSHLDGIPLAIELAAARVRHLTPQQICDGLVDRFHLLTGGGRTAMPRHQTLEASIDWSHSLLTDPERTLLRRLAIFARDFTLEAAHRVAAGPDIETGDVLDLLGHLVDKSLVFPDEGTDESRFRLLESIREYALRRLHDSGEEEDVGRRHRDFYLDFAESALPSIEGSGQETWLVRLEVDHDNLRTALRWSVDRGDAGPTLRLARALAPFWTMRGYWHEGRAWLEEAARLGATDPSLRLELARTRLSGYYLAVMRRDSAEMQSIVEESLPPVRTAGDGRWLGRALTAAAERRLIVLLHYAADVDHVQEGLQEGIRIARDEGDLWGEAWALCSLGWSHVYDGDLTAGRRYFDEGLTVATRSGNHFVARLLLRNRGHLEVTRGALDEARRVLDDGVRSARAAGDRAALVQFQMSLGSTLLLLGDIDASREALEEALEVVRDLGSPRDEAMILCGLGAAALCDDDSDRALDAYDLALKLSTGDPLAEPAVLADIARVHVAQGSAPAARAAAAEALVSARISGSPLAVAGALYMQARVEQAFGEEAVAEDLCRTAVAMYGGEYALTRELAEVIELLAALLQSRTEAREAAVLLGGTEASRRITGAIRHPQREGVYETVVAAVRTDLDEDAFRAAWAEGASLSIDELMKRAAGGATAPLPRQSGPGAADITVDRRSLGRGPQLW